MPKDLKLIKELFEDGENLRNHHLLADAFTLIQWMEKEDAVYVDGTPVLDKVNSAEAHALSKELRGISARLLKQTGDKDFLDLYKKTLTFDAPVDFDAFCLRMEWNRPRERKFYEPRRKQLKPIVDKLQELETGDLEILCISLPPGVGKTTLAEFFLCWIAGRTPELSILGGSHSQSFLEGVYNEIIRFLGEGSDEYCWKEIFPGVKLVKTNAKGLRIDLDEHKRFETFQFSSIGSGNAGKVRASKLLYCDDLVSDIEQALSRDRMDKLWQQYYTDLRQRKIGGCRELHIATRWSVNDVIGRLEQQYENDPKAEFICIPALNEDDESNFDYPYNVGFTTSFYREQREIMDDPSWRALYMNEPVEREGVLIERDQLRRFFDLPEGEPDAVIGICDTKTTGNDFCSHPIAYQYGRDFYITDVFFENYAPDIVENNLIAFLKRTDPQMSRFESNVAGGKVAQIVQEKLKEAGCRCKITTKWTQANKETKIIVNMPWVKEHCLFLDESIIKQSKYKEYRDFLNQLCSYSLVGKNKHDDAADSMAMLAEFVQSMKTSIARVAKRVF